MRTLPVGACLVTAVSTLGACSVGSTHPAAACAAVVQYAGVTYRGMSLPRPSHPRESGVIPRSHMKPIGRATIPACNDTGLATPSDDVRARSLRVASINGYDRDSVIADYSTGEVYLRQGQPLDASLKHASWLRWSTP